MCMIASLAEQGESLGTSGADDALSSAPPLNRVEKVSILVLVAAGFITGTAFVTIRGVDDPLQSIFELLVTALFAGFIASPPITVLALAASMVISLWGGSSTETMLALAVATGFTARTGSNRLLVIFGGILLLSAAAAVISVESEQLTTIVVYLLLATASGSIGFLLRSARSREQRLRAQLTRRGLTEQEIRKSERLLIADELHDVVSHDLTVIVMQTELMELERKPGELVQSQRSIRDAARKALTDLHRLVNRAYDEESVVGSPPADLDSALFDAQRELSDAGCMLSVAVETDTGALPQIVTSTLARILRESVTNILKHSGESATLVTVKDEGTDVVLTVRNAMSRHGPRTPLASSGYGSIRMAQRTDLLGGTFQSRPEGRDWVVTARLPAY